MAKKTFCALTHVRHEHFFLDLWIRHYGAIVGRENLHVVIDGDDWEPDVDLTGINVTVETDAPRRRIKNDRWAASHMSRVANQLRRQHRFVLRGDVDEFVVLDPEQGNDWETALEVDAEQGYSFALGVDMAQVVEKEPELDRTGLILPQRQHGFVSDRYTKPFVISRWNNWSGGAHRLLNRPVVMNRRFVLFHLALADKDLANERHEARGGFAQHKSYHGHLDERFAMLEKASETDPMPFDLARDIAEKEFPVEEDGSVAKRPRAATDERATHYGLFTTVPERFHPLL